MASKKEFKIGMRGDQELDRLQRREVDQKQWVSSSLTISSGLNIKPSMLRIVNQLVKNKIANHDVELPQFGTLGLAKLVTCHMPRAIQITFHIPPTPYE